MKALMAVTWVNSIFVVHRAELCSYQFGTASWTLDLAAALRISLLLHLVTT